MSRCSSLYGRFRKSPRRWRSSTCWPVSPRSRGCAASLPRGADEGILQIDEGRHPVLEQSMVGEPFVPNNTQLDSKSQQIAVITGPNMAGKALTSGR
ncbi:MAG: hypothetical protein Ct9H300mP32_3000 [Verrucomicrobiota bacterium]|nr:MAG: hypothetical protein Ct9H300mP32_3000 [Verrucomicrobiota bacterium]